MRTNLDMFVSKQASPSLCKSYLNMPKQVFRAGKWVSIEEHNSQFAINKNKKAA